VIGEALNDPSGLHEIVVQLIDFRFKERSCHCLDKRTPRGRVDAIIAELLRALLLPA
jgi:hypothetical protein